MDRLAPVRNAAQPAARQPPRPDARIAYGAEISSCPPLDHLFHSPNGSYGTFSVIAGASVRHDARKLDDLCPLLSFLRNELAEVSRRPWKYCAANAGNPRLHIGVGEDRVHLLVELPDNFDGSVLGRTDATKITRLITRQEVAFSWQVRQNLQPRRGRHRQC